MKNKTKEEKQRFELIDNLLNEISPEEQKLCDRKMLLAVKIDEAMKSQGIKKGQLAKQLSKNPSEITKWLSGTHNFTVETLWEIGDALKCDFITLEEAKDERVIYFAYAAVSGGPSVTTFCNSSLAQNLTQISNKQDFMVASN